MIVRYKEVLKPLAFLVLLVLAVTGCASKEAVKGEETIASSTPVAVPPPSPASAPPVMEKPSAMPAPAPVTPSNGKPTGNHDKMAEPPPRSVTIQPPPPPPVSAKMANGQPKGTVVYHVWGALLSYGFEQKEYPGYAAYTYVLFNSNQPDADSPEGKRYDGILRAVLLDVKSQATGIAAGWEKYETNIFCIPFVTKSPQKADALEKYDYVLSQKYLAVLQGAVESNKDLFKRLEQRPGPFLISLYEPLPRLQGKEATKMLYLDLTDMPADGMRQVLDAYKQRLDDEPLRNVEKLKESLKITLMKYALMLDENLKIVDVAFAKFK